jgi:ribosomal protein S18 acetylase RimI-like enzyme
VAEFVVRRAEVQDLRSWLELVREVEPLFGPMPDFADHALRGTERGTAWVASAPSGKVLGAVLTSREDQPHKITWLAVRAEARGQGIGRALLSHTVAHWADSADVVVETFAADVLGGVAARRLYASFGFGLAEVLPPGPEGGGRELWSRRRRS